MAEREISNGFLAAFALLAQSSMNSEQANVAASPSVFARDISARGFKDGLIWLAVLGVLVRVLYLVQHAHSPFFATPTLDEQYYVAVAKMMVAGKDLHSLHGFRPLLYPMFLAACDEMGGAHGIDIAILAQHVMGILTGVLVAVLGARLFRHRLSGIAAGALYLLAPIPVSFEGEILIESSYTLLVVLVLLAHVSAAEATPGRKSAGLWFVAGALAALAAQDRVNILVLLAVYPLLTVWDWWRGKKITAFLPLLGLLGAFAMAVPWGIYNMRQSDHFHILPGAGGINLYLHNRRTADGITLKEAHRIPTGENSEDSIEMLARTDYEAAMRAQHRQPASDPMAVSQYWTRRAIEEIKADPGHWLKLVGKKAWMTFWNTEVPNLKAFAFCEEEYPCLRWLPVRWVVLLMLAPAGVWIAARTGRSRSLFIVGTFLFLYSAANLLFGFCDRYRYPTWPAMAVLAGGGLLIAIETIRQRRSGAMASLLASMALMAAISLPNWLGIKLPSFARDYLFRSMAWYENGHFPEALRDVDESLKLDPNEITTIHHRANVLLALHQLPEARQVFEQILKRSTNEAAIWNDYGATLEGLGQTNKAMQAYQRAMDLIPPRKNAFLAAAFLQLRLGHLNQAAKIMDRFDQLTGGGNAIAVAVRSIIARRQGDLQKADALEQQARRLNADAAAWAFDHAKSGSQ